VPEREERRHRERVAAVLAALHVPEVAGVRPRRQHVAQEADGVDVQVDLRVGQHPARPLRERDKERESGERNLHGAPANRARDRHAR
jgi:hypothetical protein